MNFNEKIYELNKMLDIYVKLNSDIEQEKQKQVNEFRKKLDNESKDKVEFNQTKINEILKEKFNYCKKLEYYSFFNSNDISKILINLINVFYEKEFICITIPVYKDSKFQVSKPVKILINRKYKKDYFLVNTLIDLVNNGKIVVLDENSINGILFYKYNTDKNDIKPNVNLEKFPYLKEFIDYVISYKIDRQIDKISYDTLELLKFKFISNKTSEIKLNYDIDKKQENLNKKG